MGGRSQLTFWHGTPEFNDQASFHSLGQYYMLFQRKADYPGPYDDSAIPMLDYRGRIGVQHNPIAIAQYGLGNYNLWKRTGDETRLHKSLIVADWLVEHLEDNPWGVPVWNHHFDWEYRDVLKAPWYSGLAQGQGISMLVRAHEESGHQRYLDAATSAFQSFLLPVDQGGVTDIDPDGYLWFEESIVDPPTHILNGFIWALWGVHDFRIYTDSKAAAELFDNGVTSLKARLGHYDIGYWSLYEQSGTRMKMMASPFYHSLHIVQLRVMHAVTGEQLFRQYADRWDEYRGSWFKRKRALTYKAIFKLLYY